MTPIVRIQAGETRFSANLAPFGAPMKPYDIAILIAAIGVPFVVYPGLPIFLATAKTRPLGRKLEAETVSRTTIGGLGSRLESGRSQENWQTRVSRHIGTGLHAKLCAGRETYPIILRLSKYSTNDWAKYFIQAMC